MSESKLHNQPQAESVFVLEQNGDTSLVEGTLVGQRGPNAIIKHEETGAGYHVTTEHRTNVFSPEQVAAAADELLPEVPDGEERLLSDALNETLNDAASRKEVLIRLASIAMSERFGGKREMADYGMKSVEDMVGAPDIHGSNIWKIEDLITMSKEEKNRPVTNTLLLAHPEIEELSMISSEEAASIQDQMAAANRAALDKIYDHYDVSYTNASVFELTLPDGNTLRKTIYPSATEQLYFIEKVSGQNETTPSEIEITNKAPEFSLQDGYIRVA